MTDELFQALNRVGSDLSLIQTSAIIKRYNEIQAYQEFTDGEKSAIFHAWMKKNIYQETEESDKQVDEIMQKKRCKICGLLADEGWKYINSRTLDIICFPCQERQRIQNRTVTKEQRCLF